MLVYGRNVAKEILRKNKKVEKIVLQEGFDDKELKELDSDAASLRLTRSEYVRKQIRESEMIPTPKMNYTEFTLTLALILDRVKSVADRLWHKVVFDVHMLREALRDIEKLIPKIEKEMKQCEQGTTE